MFVSYAMGYSAIAIVVAAGCYLAACRMSGSGRNSCALTSVLGGVLWPVLVVGLVQLGVVALVFARPPRTDFRHAATRRWASWKRAIMPAQM